MRISLSNVERWKYFRSRRPRDDNGSSKSDARTCECVFGWEGINMEKVHIRRRAGGRPAACLFFPMPRVYNKTLLGLSPGETRRKVQMHYCNDHFICTFVYQSLYLMLFVYIYTRVFTALLKMVLREMKWLAWCGFSILLPGFPHACGVFRLIDRQRDSWWRANARIF